jgi:hypothetical protein
MDEIEDQRNSVLDVIFETQQRIARKHQQDLEAAAASGGAGLIGSSSSLVGGSHHHHSGTQRGINPLDARTHRSEFFTVWSVKIESFVSDASKTALDLPPELSANDRRELHALADKFNLSHLSEGAGRERHLVLRKDLLHYKAPQIRPTSAAIEALKSAPQQRPNRLQENGQRTVESRYELKRVRNRDEEPKYGSEAVERAVRRLDKATDHFRNATEVGMSMEEYQREESGDSVEALLAASPSSTAEGAGLISTRAAPRRDDALAQQQSATSASAAAWSNAIAQQPPAAPVGAKQYVEQCLSCGSQSPLDYDVVEWGCCGFCDTCSKERIFRLVEVMAPPEKEEIDRSDDDADAPPRKQPRSDATAPVHAQQKEAIDKDDESDAPVDGAVTSAEEVENILAMNDVPARDIKFLGDFARLHEAAGDIGKSFFFAMSMQDVMGGDDPVLVPFTRRPRDDAVFVHVRGAMSEQRTVVVHATAMIPDIVHALDVSSLHHVRIVAPSTSMYGTSLQLLLRIDGVQGSLDSLRALTTKFGSDNFRCGRFDDLPHVVGSN